MLQLIFANTVTLVYNHRGIAAVFLYKNKASILFWLQEEIFCCYDYGMRNQVLTCKHCIFHMPWVPLLSPLLAEPFITQNSIPDIPTSHYCNPPDDTVNDTTTINDTLVSNCTDVLDDSDFFSSIYTCSLDGPTGFSAFAMLLVAIPLILALKEDILNSINR